MNRFKVVSVCPKWYESCITGQFSDFTLRYEIGKTTWARLGTIGILIFDEYESAFNWVELMWGKQDSLLQKHGPSMAILSGQAVVEESCPFVALGEKYYFGVPQIVSDRNFSRWGYSPIGTLRCAGFTPEKVAMDFRQVLD